MEKELSTVDEFNRCVTLFPCTRGVHVHFFFLLGDFMSNNGLIAQEQIDHITDGMETEDAQRVRDLINGTGRMTVKTLNKIRGRSNLDDVGYKKLRGFIRADNSSRKARQPVAA